MTLKMTKKKKIKKKRIFHQSSQSKLIPLKSQQLYTLSNVDKTVINSRISLSIIFSINFNLQKLYKTKVMSLVHYLCE